MPELPEVETVVRGLAGHLPGHRLEKTSVLRPDVLFRTSARSLAATVKERRVESVTRRAKYIVVRLEGDAILTVHLGMTGRLLFFPPGKPIRTSHLAVRWKLSDGARLAYDDVRRFGQIWAGAGEAWEDRSGDIGPEPLDPAFEAASLFEALKRSKAPTRSWLLDQRKIAGVGNIYANEALFLAGVRPHRPARDVTEEEARRLHAGLRLVLERAIDSGGTTLRDYRNADGAPGENQRSLVVYGREGLPCPTCQAPVEREVFGGRSAFLCPTCQR